MPTRASSFLIARSCSELESRPHLRPSRSKRTCGLTEVRDVHARGSLLATAVGRHVVGVEHVEDLGRKAHRPALAGEQGLPEAKIDVAVPVLEVVVRANGALS